MEKEIGVKLSKRDLEAIRTALWEKKYRDEILSDELKRCLEKLKKIG